MMRRHVLVALAAMAACGDSSKVCGEGTTDVDGVCTPTAQCGSGTVADPSTGQCVPDGSMICTDGTIFEDGHCVIDPNSCQDGTVLVNGKCVDAGIATADITEAAEPNGLGVSGEDSNTPAGTITLKAAGGPGFVIHGTIDPFQDNDGDVQPDADVDTYVLSVTGPTLIRVTADGVHGLAAGFAVVAAVAEGNPLATWERIGINLAGDTSQRQVYLPAAGTYLLIVADTRTLFLQGAAAGGPDADYYVTIDQLALPTPTPLALTNNQLTKTAQIGEEVQFFTVPMGTGFNRITLFMPQPQAVASMVLVNQSALRRVADETTDIFGDPQPAAITAGGIETTDSTMIVVDDIYNYGLDPANYVLTIKRGDATPLSRTGGTVSQPEVSANPGDLSLFNVFSYDVATAGEIDGIDLAWNHPVDGILTDQDSNIVGNFTFDPFVGFQGDTFASYTGLVRHRTAGRYYFVVYDPNNGGTDTLTATSTIAAVAPATVALATPATSTTNAFNSVPFTFDSTSADWDQFDATGNSTGNLTVGFFNPASAYGALDTVDVDQTNSGGGPTTFAPDAAQLFGYAFPETGGARGKILLRQPTKSYLVRVNTQAAIAGRTFTLDFRPRAGLDDLATVAGGASAMAANQALDTTTTQRFYLVRSDLGNKLTVTASPTTPTLDTQIQFLTDDEGNVGAPANNGNAGAPDTATGRFTQTYLAWKVTGAPLGATASTYDLTAAVAAPTPYAVTATTTTLSDACTGGTVQTLVPTSSFPATDEGLTAPIAAPAGFTLYGDPTTTLRISSNGWLAFGTITGSAAANQQLPTTVAPNGVVAPYWDDLDQTVVCTKTVGAKLVVQWTAHIFGAPAASVVQTQAILDPADSSIEFVWGPAQKGDGTSATVGIEDFQGLVAKLLTFNMLTVAPSTAKKLTPM